MINRRRFVQLSGGAALGVAGLSQVSVAQTTSESSVIQNEPMLEMQAWQFGGKPVNKSQLGRLYFLDLQENPQRHPVRQVEAGRVRSQPPALLPCAVALKLPVDGFGNVTLYADNQGQGYDVTDFPLNLNQAFAQTRLYRVRQTVEQWQQQGFVVPAATLLRLQRADVALGRGNQASDLSEQLHWWQESLLDSLWAGEEVAIARAKQRIAQQEQRADFLFGGNFFRYPSGGEIYNQRFRDIFNYATVPFYWRSFEPEPGQPDYLRIDSMTAWLQQAGIVAKGHPLVWFHQAGVPDWMRDVSFGEMQDKLRSRILDITQRYRGRIAAFDVMNEANNVPWANELGYSLDQLMEITDLACRTTQQGNPDATRVVNYCCLWAEEVAESETPAISPYQFVQNCFAADISFEVIGLQLYYPHQDMFEIDRMLDRFGQFGKPVHVTELGVASATENDMDALIHKPGGRWHAPWSQAVQADWVEQFYTLCFSKPHIEAVSWWDLSDIGNFWPHGGLVDDDMQPKEAYRRLQQLITTWRQL
ncbi:MAG: endo-1,4-beta-xylanase [Thainema sp.]